jgi:drug/metabolite transporter (DMT)-like permease
VCYKKRPKPLELAAVSITMLGMLLFFAGDLEAGNILGNILAIASGLSFAGVFVCNKRQDAIPEQSLLLGFLINAVIGLPFAFFGVTADISAWAAVIVLGVVQVGFAYVFFTHGIKRTPALLAMLITAIEPVLNPVWVAVFLGEMPGPFAIAGGTVIVLTVVCYNILHHRHLTNADIMVE